VIKTILVAASGGRGDMSAFETALTLARPLAAHLDFYHAWVTPDDAAALSPHVDFAQGDALKDALERLQHDAEKRSAAALRSFREFCDRRHVSIAEPDESTTGVTAAWIEEKVDPLRGLTWHARHHDLVVIGSPNPEGGLRPDLAGQLLLASGRPMVLAPPAPRTRSSGVIIIGWKETPEAARAMTAVSPLLPFAQRVIVASVQDGRHARQESLESLIRQLRRRGVAVEAMAIGTEGYSVADRLLWAAESVDADLMVVGAYGHTRIWELIFGGVTRALLEARSAAPVLLMH
jgi:nucleotide-binding universal stress UspA family protein